MEHNFKTRQKIMLKASEDKINLGKITFYSNVSMPAIIPHEKYDNVN